MNIVGLQWLNILITLVEKCGQTAFYPHFERPFAHWIEDIGKLPQKAKSFLTFPQGYANVNSMLMAEGAEMWENR